MDDITISANTIYTSAGGIYNQGAITMTHSSILKNVVLAATGPGGGIVNFGSLVLSDVDILSNTITGYGGGLSNNTGSTARLTRVNIAGNHANSGGGHPQRWRAVPDRQHNREQWDRRLWSRAVEFLQRRMLP